MSGELHELDQTHAIFAAMSSFWWRILLFFAFCVFGHYVGVNCASAGELIRDVWSSGPSALFSHGDFNPVFAPLHWMWTLLTGCEHPVGVLQLFALGVAILFIWLSEDRFIHGFAIVLITQPLHSFLVTGWDNGRSDFIIGLIVVGFYEAFAGFAYWWCLRQME